jgi:hypothetical protein
MSKVYAVYHCWSEFYYNTISWEEELICCFDSLEKAEEFKAKYSLPYDKSPWALQKGQIKIKELPTSYDEKKLWWLEKPKTTETVKQATREELKKLPKSNIPMFLEISEDEVEFNKE